MSNKIYSISLNKNKYNFELIGEKLYYLPKQEENVSTFRLNKEIIEVPQILVITRTNGVPLFALEPDDKDYNQFDIMTVQQLYSRKIQWFEPLADNYRKLVWLNEESFDEKSIAYAAYKHFTWEEIIKFSLKDRMMLAYYKNLWGDWKKRKIGGAGYYVVMVNKKPYWTDAIGQIPFSVDCMRDNVFKARGDYDRAIRQTIRIGMNWGEGTITGKVDNTNSYDNYFILRTCLWSIRKFLFVEKSMHDGIHLSIEEADGDFLEILSMEITEAQRDKYALWKY